MRRSSNLLRSDEKNFLNEEIKIELPIRRSPKSFILGKFLQIK
jgi:hypothetical protein